MASLLRCLLNSSSCPLSSSSVLMQAVWRASSFASVTYPLQLASVSDQHGALYQESLRNPEQFWGELARQRLRWVKEFDTVMDCEMREARFRWFRGGQLNVSGEFQLGRDPGVGHAERFLAQTTVWTAMLSRHLTRWPSSGRRMSPTSMRL